MSGLQVLSTKRHGLIDYASAVLLIAGPPLTGIANGGPAQWVPVGLGLATIVYSVLTRYELGAIPLLPMRLHLVLDVVNGLVLASSPWVFGFAGRVAAPYIIFGVIEILVALVTRTRPSARVPL